MPTAQSTLYVAKGYVSTSNCSVSASFRKSCEQFITPGVGSKTTEPVVLLIYGKKVEGGGIFAPFSVTARAHAAQSQKVIHDLLLFS